MAGEGDGPKFTRDKDGRPRATWGKGGLEGELIADYLQTDVVDSGYAEKILVKGKASRVGTPAWRVTGNGYRLVLGPRRARVTRLFGGGRATNSVSLPTKQFLDIVRDWRGHLES